METWSNNIADFYVVNHVQGEEEMESESHNVIVLLNRSPWDCQMSK